MLEFRPSYVVSVLYKTSASSASLYSEPRRARHIFFVLGSVAAPSFWPSRSSLCTMPERVEYPPMTASPKTIASPIKFGTSGWRGIIADDFTFGAVRLAVTAIAAHINAKTKNPTELVGYDTRFYSEEFSQLAVEILQQHKIRTLLCDTFTPTPAVAYEIMRRKLDGAINFTASHNPAQYHGLKFSSSDAGPALPEVTKDIEARVAKIIEKDGPFPFAHAAPSHLSKSGQGKTVNLRETYLKRLEELVRFD